MEEELEEQENDTWKKFFRSDSSFSNIKITNDFNYEPRFNGVFSKNNFPRITHGAYVIYLDDKSSKGTYWISLLLIEIKLNISS